MYVRSYLFEPPTPVNQSRMDTTRKTEMPNTTLRKKIRSRRKKLPHIHENYNHRNITVDSLLLFILTTRRVVMTQAVVYARVTGGIYIYSCMKLWRSAILMPFTTRSHVSKHSSWTSWLSLVYRLYAPIFSSPTSSVLRCCNVLDNIGVNICKKSKKAMELHKPPKASFLILLILRKHIFEDNLLPD